MNIDQMEASVDGLHQKFDAIKIAIQIEAIVKEYGHHVALTGGVLYKTELRKDIDYVLYSEDRFSDTDEDKEAYADIKHEMFRALSKISVAVKYDYGYVVKAKLRSHNLDFLLVNFPGDSTYDEIPD